MPDPCRGEITFVPALATGSGRLKSFLITDVSNLKLVFTGSV